MEEGAAILGEYTYNGLGQRVIKDAAWVETVFLYDFNGNIVAESASDGTMKMEYLYAEQARMAMVDVGAGQTYFFANNYLGTPLLVTDSSGNVVWEADYKPFGDATVNPNSTVVNNFRFAGQYYDEETGLHYNYHRYYDPKIGRYPTPDPIGLRGGLISIRILYLKEPSVGFNYLKVMKFIFSSDLSDDKQVVKSKKKLKPFFFLYAISWVIAFVVP